MQGVFLFLTILLANFTVVLNWKYDIGGCLIKKSLGTPAIDVVGLKCVCVYLWSGLKRVSVGGRNGLIRSFNSFNSTVN